MFVIFNVKFAFLRYAGPHLPNPACPPPVNPSYPAMPIPQCPPGQNPVYPPGMNHPTTIPYMTPNQQPFPPAATGPYVPFPGAGHPCPVPSYGGHQPGMDVHGHKKQKKMKKKGKKAHKAHKEHKHVKHGKVRLLTVNITPAEANHY